MAPTRRVEFRGIDRLHQHHRKRETQGVRTLSPLDGATPETTTRVRRGARHEQDLGDASAAAGVASARPAASPAGGVQRAGPVQGHLFRAVNTRARQRLVRGSACAAVSKAGYHARLGRGHPWDRATAEKTCRLAKRARFVEAEDSCSEPGAGARAVQMAWGQPSRFHALVRTRGRDSCLDGPAHAVQAARARARRKPRHGCRRPGVCTSTT